MQWRKRAAREEPEPSADRAGVDFHRLIAYSDPKDLSPASREAKLAFDYNAFVLHNGHFGYFEAFGVEGARQAVAALRALGAEEHATLLTRAIAQEEHNASVKEAEMEDEDFDDVFEDIKPDLHEVLDAHQRVHAAEVQEEVRQARARGVPKGWALAEEIDRKFAKRGLH